MIGTEVQRYFNEIPSKSPMLNAVLLGGAIIVAVSLFIEAPAKVIATPAPDVRHFLIGFLFNGPRILALGVTIGTMHRHHRQE